MPRGASCPSLACGLVHQTTDLSAHDLHSDWPFRVEANLPQGCPPPACLPLTLPPLLEPRAIHSLLTSPPPSNGHLGLKTSPDQLLPEASSSCSGRKPCSCPRTPVHACAPLLARLSERTSCPTTARHLARVSGLPEAQIYP